MTLGTETSHSPDSAHTDWPEAREHPEGWKRRLTVTGAEHFSFTNLPYPAGQPGLSDPAPRPLLSDHERGLLADKIDGARDERGGVMTLVIELRRGVSTARTGPECSSCTRL